MRRFFISSSFYIEYQHPIQKEIKSIVREIARSALLLRHAATILNARNVAKNTTLLPTRDVLRRMTAVLALFIRLHGTVARHHMILPVTIAHLTHPLCSLPLL